MLEGDLGVAVVSSVYGEADSGGLTWPKDSGAMTGIFSCVFAPTC